MAAAKKNKSKLFGSILAADRFSARNTEKKPIYRSSITEFSGLSQLSERLVTDRKVIFNAKEINEEQIFSSNFVEDKYHELIDSIDFTLSIPPRVPYTAVDKGEYKEVEAYVFGRWKSQFKDQIFERNIEIWRQFWITCERSDTIAQIIDARNIEFFLNRDILRLYPQKNHVLFCNKADLVSQEVLRRFMAPANVAVHVYSTVDETFDYKLSGTVGLIGYPNVGKSSTVNTILKSKRVRVSATPGKTKHIQTIETPQFNLIDCPGLVFPRHSKLDLILNGILNVDQSFDFNSFEKQIVDHISTEKIRKFYHTPARSTDVLKDLSAEKGWQRSKCLKMIVKDFTSGVLL